jgi:hypothetical protein
MEPNVMTVEPQAEKRRFLIVKLEERIAPSGCGCCPWINVEVGDVNVLNDPDIASDNFSDNYFKDNDLIDDSFNGNLADNSSQEGGGTPQSGKY